MTFWDVGIDIVMRCSFHESQILSSFFVGHESCDSEFVSEHNLTFNGCRRTVITCLESKEEDEESADTDSNGINTVEPPNKSVEFLQKRKGTSKKGQLLHKSSRDRE